MATTDTILGIALLITILVTGMAMKSSDKFTECTNTTTNIKECTICCSNIKNFFGMGFSDETCFKECETKLKLKEMFKNE